MSGIDSIYKPGLLPTDYIGNLTAEGYSLVGTYMCSIGFFSVLANIFVIYASLKFKVYIGRQDILLVVNMAFSDLLISISGHPMVAASSFVGHWVFGDHGCVFFAFMYFTLSMVSMNTLVGIGIFRYVLICRPKYYKYLSTTNTKRVIFVCWIYAVACTAPPLFGWSFYTYESFGTSCSMNWLGKSTHDITYIVFTILFCFLGHIAILTVCYIKISRGAQDVAVRLFHELRAHPRRMIEHITDLRAVTLVSFVVVLAFLLAWTPYAVISIVQIWVHVKPEVAILPTMGAKLTCLTNPLIISLFTKRYRKICWSMVDQWFCKVSATNTVAPLTARRGRLTRNSGVFSITQGELRGRYPHAGHSFNVIDGYFRPYCQSASEASLANTLSDEVDGIIRFNPGRMRGNKVISKTASVGSTPTLSIESMNCYEHLQYIPRQYMAMEPQANKANADLALSGYPDLALSDMPNVSV